MRTLFIITCLANIVFAFGMLPWMPEKVAIHFGANGMPNGWASPIPNAILLSITTAIMGAGILGCSFLTALCAEHMPEHFNIPNRDYWLNEENRPKTIRRICSFTEFIGIGIMLFFLFVQWEIFWANQKVPVIVSDNVWVAVVVLFVSLGIETVRLFLAFRLPKEKDKS